MEMNVVAVIEMIKLAKEMKNLEVNLIIFCIIMLFLFCLIFVI